MLPSTFFTLLSILSSTSLGQESLWPSLSSPGAVGGGGKDAAVVVAIEDYSFVSDITGARQNGEDWYRYLTRGRGIPADRVSLLVDVQATKGGIEHAVSQMTAQVQPEGTLWFVFIGHGAPSVDGRDGLLLEVDVRGEALSIYDRSIRQSDLIGLLEVGQQSQTVLLLDACFSGQSSGSGSVLAEGLQPLIPNYEMASGSRTVVLSAGGSDQFAGPLPGASRPAFSYLALGALHGWGDIDGDNIVTVQEVAEYSASALRSVLTGRQQTPMLSGSGGDWSLGKGRSSTAPDLVDIRLKLLGPYEPASQPVRPQQDLTEVRTKSTAVQREATQIWSQVKALASKGDAAGKQALQAFVQKYQNMQVKVGEQSYPVEIPEVAEARRLLERYVENPYKPSLARVSGENVEILEQVFFDPGTPVIKPASYALLNEVASVLEEYRSFSLVRIEGHTDSRGASSANQILSQRRAEAVREYLISRGIEPSRLVAVGYGEDRPKDPRENHAAWDINRRVEFVIVERVD